MRKKNDDNNKKIYNQNILTGFKNSAAKKKALQDYGQSKSTIKISKLCK